MAQQEIGWGIEAKLLAQIKSLIARNGGSSVAFLQYPDATAFPPTGQSGAIYLALDTNKIYYWDGSGYVEMAGSGSSVVSYPSLASFPMPGSTGVIYIALDTNRLYRWDSGTTSYIEVSPATDAIVVLGGGAYSSLRCGSGNATTGDYSTAFGRSNTASGPYTSIFGQCNTASGVGSTVMAGFKNQAQGSFSTIGGGICNNACNVTSACLATGAAVLGGIGNNTSNGTWDLASCSFLTPPTICDAGAYSTIGGGFQNKATGGYTTVFGGYNNTASGLVSAVGGGTTNQASGACSFIGGGKTNTSSGAYSAILAGKFNDTNNFADAMIIGSNLTASQACTTFVNNISVDTLIPGSAVCVTTNKVLTTYSAITGSGTAGQVTYWSGTSAVTGSSDLVWDNTNKSLIVLNTNASSYSNIGLGANGGINVRGINLYAFGSTYVGVGAFSPSYVAISTGSSVARLAFVSFGSTAWYNNGSTASNEVMQLTNNGRLLIGTTTDGGQRLQVIGSMRVGSTAASAMYWDDTNNRLGIGTSSPSASLHVIGNALFAGTGGTSVGISTTANFLHDAVATAGNIAWYSQSLLSMIMPGANTGLNIFPSAANENNTTSEVRVTTRKRSNAHIYQAAAATNITGAAIAGAFAATGTYTLDSLNNLNGAFVSGVRIAESFTATIPNQNAAYAGFTFASTINQSTSVGLTAVTRGLYINPTLTSVVDFRAIETTAGNVLFGSNFFWDNTNGRLGIGTSSPGDILDIRKNQVTTSVATTTSLLVSNTNANGIAAIAFTSDGTTRQGGLQYNNQSGFRNLFSCTYTTIPYYFGTNNLIRLTITGDTGNVMINTTTDGGQRLQVIGSMRVGTTAASAMYWDDTNNRLGIGVTSPSHSLDISGNGRIQGNSYVYGNFIDNRDNSFISQSATGVTSNRDLSFGNGTYGRIMYYSKQVSFTSGTHPALGAYGFYYNGETNTGGSHGVSIYFKAQTPSATNSNGGDFIIDLPLGTGTGRNGRVGIGESSPTSILDLTASTTLNSSLRIRSGTAPTSPNDGDIWYDGTNIYIRVGATTKTFTIV